MSDESNHDILVVEDDPLSALLVHDLLTSRGHQVRSAANVSEAVAQLKQRRPDLLLLDVQLPGGGGQAVVKVVREDPALASLQVVALTALAMAGDRERILALGFDAYLSKPISLKAFFALVDEMMAKR
jgi:two-component system cell cycle response regulator